MPRRRKLIANGDVVDVQLTRRFSGHDVTGNSLVFDDGRLRGTSDQHEIAVGALEFGVVSRPAPATQARRFFYLDDFEQIVLRHLVIKISPEADPIRPLTERPRDARRSRAMHKRRRTGFV